MCCSREIHRTDLFLCTGNGKKQLWMQMTHELPVLVPHVPPANLMWKSATCCFLFLNKISDFSKHLWLFVFKNLSWFAIELCLFSLLHEVFFIVENVNQEKRSGSDNSQTDPPL